MQKTLCVLGGRWVETTSLWEMSNIVYITNDTYDNDTVRQTSSVIPWVVTASVGVPWQYMQRPTLGARYIRPGTFSNGIFWG